MEEIKIKNESTCSILSVMHRITKLELKRVKSQQKINSPQYLYNVILSGKYNWYKLSPNLELHVKPSREINQKHTWIYEDKLDKDVVFYSQISLGS